MFDSVPVTPALLISGVVLMLGWRKFQGLGVRKKVRGMKSSDMLIVDVRSRDEFKAGAHQGSRNIPLDELERSVTQLDRTKTIVLCCASGMRSGMAEQILKKAGFQNVVNAGSWRNLPSEVTPS